jgi:hypothetical protein
MTVTVIPPQTAESPGMGAAFVTGLIDVAVHYAVHTGTPLPVPRLSIPVRGGTRGERIDALDEIADRLEVEVALRDGTLVAERWFGPVLVEAHLDPEDDHARRLALLDQSAFDDASGAVRSWCGTSVPGNAA